MEFKKSYKFMDFLPAIILFGIFIAGYIALIVWTIVYGISEDWPNEVIIAIVIFVLFILGSLVCLLVLCQSVTIDEEKVELKDLKGVVLRFYINDIYKIEKKPGAKGSIVCVIHGSTPQNHSRKTKVKTIAFEIDKKREEIIRHFITNPEVWNTES